MTLRLYIGLLALSLSLPVFSIGVNESYQGTGRVSSAGIGATSKRGVRKGINGRNFNLEIIRKRRFQRKPPVRAMGGINSRGNRFFLGSSGSYFRFLRRR